MGQNHRFDIDDAMLTKLKALSRRGAVLRREADGGGLVQQQSHQPRRSHSLRLLPRELTQALAAGWLRQLGGDGFVLSRRGAGALRRALSRQGVETPAEPATALRPASDDNARAQPSATGPPKLNARESPLAWLHQRRNRDGQPLISQAQFDAGERLRLDFELAQLMPRVTASWGAAVPAGRRRGPEVGLELSERALAARMRVEAALQAVGPELANVLLDVCCFLKGLEQAELAYRWPRRSGKVLLHVGLAQLARHYGLAPDTGKQAIARAGIASWAVADYRPSFDAASPGES